MIVSEATDAVDEGLSLIVHWKSQAPAEFAAYARDIFRFGCRIYENGQPHSLAEYVMEYLGAEAGDKPISADNEILDAAQAAIWGALAKLQADEQMQRSSSAVIVCSRATPRLSTDTCNG